MKNQYALIVLSLVMLSSCSVFRETHYFKDKIEDDEVFSSEKSISNYYKVKIKGWAFLSSSRYVSGYFDTQAVNQYFNEISQPSKGQFFTNNKSDNGQPDKPAKDKPSGDTSDATASDPKANDSGNPEVTETKPVPSSTPEPQKDSTPNNENQEGIYKETGEELVLILSSNADAVATEIKNTSINNDILKSLTLLSHKDKIEKANMLATEKSGVNKDIDLYLLKMDAQLGNIKETSALKHNQAVLFQLLKIELKDMGVNKEFKDFNELKTWYHENF